MKTKVFLDEKDVQLIVAKHYNVQPNNVDVHLFITTEGYGIGEYEAAAIEVTVTTDDGIEEP